MRQKNRPCVLYNNKIGREYVKNLESIDYNITDKEIRDAILRYLSEGKLKYIVDNHWYDKIIKKDGENMEYE